MKNFPFQHEGQELWYSRSLAVSLCTFAFNIDENDSIHVYVLANKRGPGCEFNRGKWNMPGGFIDFGETCENCASRETFEETGVSIPESYIFFNNLDSKPTSGRQTILASYFSFVLSKEKAEYHFSTENSEPGEVEEIKFIDLLDVHKYNWTRNQIMMIAQCFNKFIDMKLYKDIGLISPERDRRKNCKEEFEAIFNKFLDNNFPIS